MNYIYLNICLGLSVFFFLPFSTYSQTVSLGYSLGKTVKNNPVFPPLLDFSQSFYFQYEFKPNEKQVWGNFYPKTKFNLSASGQTLGNNEILGRAWAIVPALKLYFYNKKRYFLSLNLGLGLSYLTKHYDSFKNPQNVVIGSTINACGKADFGCFYSINSRFCMGVEFGLTHYSNAGVQSPNLGVNIAQSSLTISYCLSAYKPIFTDKKDSLKNSLKFIQKHQNSLKNTNKFDTNTSIFFIKNNRFFNPIYRPLIQAGLGLTSIASRGAKYPIYGLFIGVAKQWNAKFCFSAGLEWIYNTATYELYNNQAVKMQKSSFYRYSFLTQCEFIFGNFTLLTAGGIYLNSHVAQRSLLATKIGINYYPRSLFRFKNHHFYLGLQVRAYFGEAEFAEMVAGYKW
jgi:Lipid A 3-O-deacylase (PagL)